MHEMKRPRFWLVAVAAVLLAAGIGQADTAIKWYEYNAGTAAAKDAGKKTLLYFYTDWCTFCKKMDKQTFGNPAVSDYLADHYIAIRVNADAKRALARQYGTEGMPVSFFLTPEGQRISKLPGYIPPGRFLKILKYIGTDSYRKMPLGAFKE